MAAKRYATGGGVIIVGEKMLLLDRPTRKEVRLPKGHIDPGETAEQTALRETTEETGYADLAIRADLGTHQVKFVNKGEKYIRDERYYLMSLQSERKKTRSEEDEKQFVPIWVNLSEAAETLTFAAEQEVAKRAIAAYRQLQTK